MSHLSALSSKFEHTFTDISASMVSQASNAFQAYGNMTFQTLDINSTAPAELFGRFDLIFATNAATPDLRRSCENIHRMLDHDGLMVLLELTCGDLYLDSVFGHLEGWWCMKDGRRYPLQSEEEWAKTLGDCGFHDVRFAVEPVLDNARLVFGHARASGIPIQLEESRLASSSLVQGCHVGYDHSLFLFPGGHGSAATWSSLPSLGYGMTVFGLNSPFWKDDVPYTVSFYELARRCISEIKRVKPHGPYILGGYSFGGVVAYEAARQMIEASDQVDHLILIDSACPLIYPRFSPALLEFFDSVDINHDTVDKRGDQRPAEPAASKMQHPHILGNGNALAGYKPIPMPSNRTPQTTLFAARDGIDGRRTRPLPTSTGQTQK
ncbi:hypothetical protein M409DRAFT_25172 [Zasmidium cellare ATCC 36951]|uniref:Thioesterase domain-containing protein n=1 Tax=Zasmidium cellare ATCC 36951 TaxID=1080233 RepID=A0A6A6CED9_ZASCE|nr:uncharacterized protein M409DRAFT_25172 [Zasmidium cellare ATCC 36951]KAF2164292.1 hypothetical protein M409DRAFT_25172 [Zasmidium cellare ATCC 36951]